MKTSQSSKWKRIFLFGIITGILLFIGVKATQYYFDHNLHWSDKQRLHIRNEYRYDVIQNESIDVFTAYRVIQFDAAKDISTLKQDYKNDLNIREIEELFSSPVAIFQNVRDQYPLPFSLDCGCYSLYAVNEMQSDGGYLYHVVIHEKTMYVYYASR